MKDSDLKKIKKAIEATGHTLPEIATRLEQTYAAASWYGDFSFDEFDSRICGLLKVLKGLEEDRNESIFSA